MANPVRTSVEKAHSHRPSQIQTLFQESYLLFSCGKASIHLLNESNWPWDDMLKANDKSKYISRWWFQIFVYFHLYLGKWSNLTNIFQMGWNHHYSYTHTFFWRIAGYNPQLRFLALVANLKFYFMKSRERLRASLWMKALDARSLCRQFTWINLEVSIGFLIIEL